MWKTIFENLEKRQKIYEYTPDYTQKLFEVF